MHAHPGAAVQGPVSVQCGASPPDEVPAGGGQRGGTRASAQECVPTAVQGFTISLILQFPTIPRGADFVILLLLLLFPGI